MKFTFENSVAFVSGGSLGMGREIARELFHEGCRVVIAARREEKLQEAIGYITKGADAARHAQVKYVVADMGDKQGIDAAIQFTTRTFGPPSLVLSNVQTGVLTYSFEASTAEDFAKAHGNLVLGLVHLVKACIEPMKAAGYGRFLNLGSVSTKEPHRWLNLTTSVTYRVAALSLFKCLANEYAPHGITFNTIAPGDIDTGLGDWILKDAPSKGFPLVENQPKIMMGRPGRVDEISGLATFILSDRSSYITGQNLTVDGGWTRCLM